VSTPERVAARPPGAGAALVRRIHHGTRKPANWMQLLRFGAVGASGYVVNLAAFAVLTGPLDLHHLAAAVFAFCVAVANNFAWNRHWTFDARGGHAGSQAMRFFTVSVLGLCVNLALLELFVSVAGLAELPAQALAVALTMPVNFIGNKLWTFAG
jgi:putative flippase GtrA